MSDQVDVELPLCPTRLISDAAVKEDAFRHKSVATAIASMIYREPGGCAIALTGSWGSGKSTVIRLLEEKLKSDHPNVRTFVFDAWSHQGDPLRRTFLERLVEWAQYHNLLTSPAKYWRGVKKKLARRREKTKTTTTPQLTCWGIAGAFSLLVAPVAMQLYQKIHYKWHPYWADFALTLSAAPILVGLLAFLWWFFQREKPLLTFFLSSSVNESTSDTSKTPEPTSLEFEKYYRNLMNEVLSDPQNKVLLVIDNLDRMSHNDSRSIWATLQVFFDPALQASVDWYDRVWLLVPFDPNGIPLLSEADEHKEGCGQASTHFLEKMFISTFHVPPVILSNWEEFLHTQLQCAFPQHTADEFHKIFRLFDHILTLETKPPTPRNMKIFVNNLGALHRQWQDNIPLPEQALLVLLLERKNFLEQLRNSGTYPIIPKTLSDLLSPNWQVNLAAMFFNVKPELAIQELLSQPIKEALWSGDTEALKRLEEYPGFKEELERIIEKLYGQTNSVEPRILARNAMAVSDLNEKDENVIRPLVHLAEVVEKWSLSMRR